MFDLDAGPVTFFLDLVELDSTRADGILTTLRACLRLSQHWIRLGVDGAVKHARVKQWCCY